MIYSFNEVESTNETAKLPQFRNAGHGTVITADSQTAGKGRFGKKFYSPPRRGIYMSVILEAKVCTHTGMVDCRELVTVFAAVCVCHGIERLTSKKPQIKWVNDIFLEKNRKKKKICGILAESSSGNPERIIVGIGLNFNGGDFPEDLPSAGALFENDDMDENEAAITKEQLLHEIVNRLTAPIDRADTIAQYQKRLIESTKDAEEFFNQQKDR